MEEEEGKVDIKYCHDSNFIKYLQCMKCLKIPLKYQKVCSKCHKIICYKCIKALEFHCPNKCINCEFTLIPLDLEKSIKNIRIICSRCKLDFSQADFKTHKTKKCFGKCSNKICRNFLTNKDLFDMTNSIEKIYFCSLICKYSNRIIINEMALDNPHDKEVKILHELLEEFKAHNKQGNDIPRVTPGNINTPATQGNTNSDETPGNTLIHTSSIEDQKGKCSFSWRENFSQKIKLNHSLKKAYFKNSSSNLWSLISDREFQENICYWEIKILRVGSESDIRIGVVITDLFSS